MMSHLRTAEDFLPWLFLVTLTVLKILARPTTTFEAAPFSETSPLIWEAGALVIAGTAVAIGKYLSGFANAFWLRLVIAAGIYVSIPLATLFARAVALDSVSDAPFRLFTESLAITIASAALTIVLVSPQMKIKERERALFRQEAVLKEFRESATHQRRDAHRAIASQVREHIEPEVSRVISILKGGSLSKKAVDTLVMDIQRSISGVVKPFSRRLVADTNSLVQVPLGPSSEANKRFGFLRAVPLRSAVFPGQASALLACFLLAVLARDFTRADPPQASLLALCAGLVAVTWLFVTVCRILIPRACTLPQPIMWLALTPFNILVVGLPFFGLRQIPDTLFNYGQWGFPTDFPSADITAAIAGAALALAGVLYARREQMIRQTASFLEQADQEIAALRTEVWHIHRQTALMVHGSVQGALIATGLRLQREGTTQEVVSRMIRRLEEGLRVVREAPLTQPVDQFLDSLVDAWTGVFDVTWTSDSDTLAALAEQPSATAATCEITREAINNAVFRGHATAVHAVIRSSRRGEVQLTITDDGRGPSDSGSPGLGSDLLNTVCTDWSLTREDGRTIVRATVALVTPEPARGS